MLHPARTFERFVVVPENASAWKLAQALATRDHSAPRGVFMYGPAGAGKTHLLHALAAAFAARYAGAALAVTTAESFLHAAVNALRSDRAAELSDRYRGIELLLIDDLQMLAGRGHLLHCLFETAEPVTRHGGRVVCASGLPPVRLAGRGEPAPDGLAGFALVRLARPGHGSTIRILEAEAATLGVKVPPSQLRTIARRAHGDVGRAIGALRQAAFAISATQREPS